MGQSLSDLGAASKRKHDLERINEMKDRGIHFPSPGETITEIPDFENAGEAMQWSWKLDKNQLKAVKDIPFRVAGRMPMSIAQRINLSPMNHDSLEKLTSSGAIQQVFKVIKNPEGITEWVGAKRGGEMRVCNVSSCRHSKRF